MTNRETEYSILTNIQANIRLLLTKVNKIMTSIDDLNAAVTSLQANMVALDSAIQAEVTALKDALAAGNSAAVETAVTNISNVSSAMTKDVNVLVTSVSAPGAATPAAT